ncbi:methionine--tRNA ligase [Actinoplanes sp. N902-109]|uniref:methionine--tRNA ligase n=1 Tax=Actinoplanes sp. (strain N902-109) TaxID=649831 RepID=UPI0003295BC7|nr:methionine--tRNA ligase [Actinoplanes sp. N902-109]AGL20488.1 methionyl-tRNA synthetase [Actinoplanes sp. N902-109]
MTFYVTTAIPYVNAAPHLGHALELVQADVLARHRRLRGEPVRFLTGTDDNAQKNVSAARDAGVPVADFVRANGDRFAALREPLELSFDDFIRTAEPRHRTGVTALWHRSEHDFYRRTYEGLYCPGCEQFTDSCTEHRGPLELVREENWFFRLSRYEQPIREILESGRVRVEPAARRNEVLAFVRSGLADISVSRQARGWGIPVPGDPGQVIYVWWDALANYVTALAGADQQRWWTGSDERVHVIGKGIVRFHAVYWLALLLSAGETLPTTILVHDYLTAGGAKISKSAGTAVDPIGLIDGYGANALRWWLLSEVAPLGDTDFTVDRLIARHDRDLANGIGNLVNRVLKLAPDEPGEYSGDLPARIDRALATGDFRAASSAIAEEVDRGNRLVEAERPWQLDGTRRTEVLAELLARCQVVARELQPFLPSAATELTAQLAGQAGRKPVFTRLRPRR